MFFYNADKKNSEDSLAKYYLKFFWLMKMNGNNSNKKLLINKTNGDFFTTIITAQFFR